MEAWRYLVSVLDKLAQTLRVVVSVAACKALVGHIDDGEESL